ncbi:hypothetical protein ACJX0J_012103 [Zea mays]
MHNWNFKQHNNVGGIPHVTKVIIYVDLGATIALTYICASMNIDLVYHIGTIQEKPIKEAGVTYHQLLCCKGLIQVKIQNLNQSYPLQSICGIGMLNCLKVPVLIYVDMYFFSKCTCAIVYDDYYPFFYATTYWRTQNLNLQYWILFDDEYYIYNQSLDYMNILGGACSFNQTGCMWAMSGAATEQRIVRLKGIDEDFDLDVSDLLGAIHTKRYARSPCALTWKCTKLLNLLWTHHNHSVISLMT